MNETDTEQAAAPEVPPRISLAVPLDGERELVRLRALLAGAAQGTQEAHGDASRQRRRLRALLEQAPLAISLKDRSGAVLAASRLAAEQLGLRPEDAPGALDRPLYPIDPPAAIAEQEAGVLTTGNPTTYEAAIETRDGGPRTYLWTTFPVLDEEGRLGEVATIGIDVTEARQAQQSAQALIESIAAPVLVAVAGAEVWLANAPAAELFGYGPGELPGVSLSTLLPGSCTGRRRDGAEFGVEVEATDVEGSEPPLTVLRLQTASAGSAAPADREAADALLRTAFSGAPVGMALIGLDGRLLQVNRSLCEILGFREGDLLETGLAELIHPDDATLDDRRLARLLAGEIESYRVEKRFYNRRGRQLWISLSVALSRDAGGAARHLVAAFDDVSSTKAAEAALREANAQLQALFDHVPAWLTLRALDGRFLNANDQLIRTLGTTRQDLIGSHPGSLMDPDAAALIHAEDHRIWETRQPLSSELALADESGDLHTFQVIGYPVLDETGEVSAFGSFALDITDRTAAERELRAAEERFRKAFEHAPIGMLLADLDGRIVKVNDALCAMLGHRPDELLATKYASITHPEDVELGADQTEQLLRGEIEHFHREKRYLRASGEPLWVAVHMSLLRDRDGRPLQLVQQVVDVTERRRLEKELRHEANHDPLTGLLNRRGLEAELERHVTHVNRYGARGALLVLDLDHFKTVNDTLGHEAGDQLIVTVGEILIERLRASDTVARLGGDEFAILLPDADLASAQRVAEQLVADVHEHAVLTGAQLPRQITASIGVTTFEQGMSSGDEALALADATMYEAKEAGRDRLAVHEGDRSDHSRLEARRAWGERLREALEHDQLTLVAQPLVTLAEGGVIGHELLLRMVERGDSIPPGAFLYIAERYDLVQELDRWVAARAIALLERHAGPVGAPGTSLAVNVSAKSLDDEHLLELVEHELKARSVDASRLVFEVSEASAIANVQLARRFSERFGELGCRFALDDFGAGFGSFYYLKHIPFDLLKIDRELIAGARTNRTDRLVVQSLVSIARGLGKQTVAKGVEHADTARFLLEAGVDLAQGYHLGHPAPVALDELHGAGERS